MGAPDIQHAFRVENEVVGAGVGQREVFAVRPQRTAIGRLYPAVVAEAHHLRDEQYLLLSLKVWAL